MPSFFMRDLSVSGFMPNTSPAPFLPCTTQLVSSRTRIICALSTSSSVQDSGISISAQTEDLKKFDVPMLIIQGDDDRIVPIQAASMLQSKFIKDAELNLYKGASNGLCSTHKDQVNQDLLDFIKS